MGIHLALDDFGTGESSLSARPSRRRTADATSWDIPVSEPGMTVVEKPSDESSTDEVEQA